MRGTRRNAGELLFDAGNILTMLLLSAVTVYPIVYILFASLSDPASLMQSRGILAKPLGLQADAYRLVFQNPMISIGYVNTLLYTGAGTALNVVMTALGAYALSRRNVYFKNAVMFMIVFTLFFQGGLIPTYLLIKELHLLDSRFAVILPSAVNAIYLIIMRTAFQAVPVSLEESARMDGANDWTILLRVVVPLSMPVIAVMTLFYGVGHWNAYFDAMVYLRTRELFPLQLVLREILITRNTEAMMTNVGSMDKYSVGQTVKYATIIVATVPILFLYPFLQKYFVKGVMIGAIKE